MISIVIPTRNRAHTLRLVAPSYFAQDLVTEVIFVNDCGTDETAHVIRDIVRDFPRVLARILDNPKRLGASQSRNVGVAEARNDFILFCDDDEYLEPGYAKICLGKLESLNAAAVSGRRIYMQDGETQNGASERFGKGLRRTPFFNPLICENINGAFFEGDLQVPFTNAIILTRKTLLQKFPYDGFYARGNGYREETDYQMNLYVNGLDIYITNDCHTFHLPMSQVRTGGQRVTKLKRVYWSIFYTHYFFKKYYPRYAERIGTRVPQLSALLMFSVFALYREFLRPLLYAAVMKLMLHSRKHNQSLKGAQI